MLSIYSFTAMSFDSLLSQWLEHQWRQGNDVIFVDWRAIYQTYWVNPHLEVITSNFAKPSLLSTQVTVFPTNSEVFTTHPEVFIPSDFTFQFPPAYFQPSNITHNPTVNCDWLTQRSTGPSYLLLIGEQLHKSVKLRPHHLRQFSVSEVDVRLPPTSHSPPSTLSPTEQPRTGVTPSAPYNIPTSHGCPS